MSKVIKNEKIHGTDTTFWESNGVIYIHNETGPAITYDDGRVQYGLNGFCLSEEVFNDIPQEEKESYMEGDRALFVINGIIDENCSLDVMFDECLEKQFVIPNELIYQLEHLYTLVADTRSKLEDYISDNNL